MAKDICDKTPIPHIGNKRIRTVEDRVERLFAPGKSYVEIPKKMRNESELLG